MNKSLLFCGMAMMTAWSVSSGSFEDRFPWLSNLDEARAVAAAQDKPLLIMFRCEP